MRRHPKLRAWAVIIGAASVMVPGAAIIMVPGPAYGDAAQTSTSSGSGGCVLSSGGVLVCGVGGGSGPETTTTSPEYGPSTTSPYTYDTVPFSIYYGGPYGDYTGDACTPAGQIIPWPIGTAYPPGYSEPYVVEQVDIVTGKVVATWNACPDTPTPTTLPPPTPEEAWAAAQMLLPTPQIEVSPSGNGLVHLQTWFWLSNDIDGAPITLTATTDTGETITAVVTPASYSWTFGPPSATAPGNGAGSEAKPSAAYTYLDAGTYEVSVTVGWTGYYLYNGTETNLAPDGPVAGPVSFAPYLVRQIRSVLTAGTG